MYVTLIFSFPDLMHSLVWSGNEAICTCKCKCNVYCSCVCIYMYIIAMCTVRIGGYKVVTTTVEEEGEAIM